MENEAYVKDLDFNISNIPFGAPQRERPPTLSGLAGEAQPEIGTMTAIAPYQPAVAKPKPQPTFAKLAPTEPLEIEIVETVEPEPEEVIDLEPVSPLMQAMADSQQEMAKFIGITLEGAIDDFFE